MKCQRPIWIIASVALRTVQIVVDKLGAAQISGFIPKRHVHIIGSQLVLITSRGGAYPLHESQLNNTIGDTQLTFIAVAAACFLASFSAFFARPDSFFTFPPLGGILLLLTEPYFTDALVLGFEEPLAIRSSSKSQLYDRWRAENRSRGLGLTRRWGD